MSPSILPTPASLAELCRCQVTDAERLAALLAPIQAMPQPFFAPDAVCISEVEVADMTAIVTAAHRVLSNCEGAAWGMAPIPSAAQPHFGPRGVFFGYDFHLTDAGPKLIEINTNAGGVLLAGALAAAQQWQCEDAGLRLTPPPGVADLPAEWLRMFKQEWRLQRGEAPLERLMIIDDKPSEQFLYPEFVLFADLFAKAGLQTGIVDASELRYDGERRCLVDAQARPVPMLYNRMTDFYLQAPEHAAIREAYLAGDVVLTPHPHAYAQYADKRNLVFLSSAALLQNNLVQAADIEVLLRGIPETQFLTHEVAEVFWRDRRQWFFKPVAGYGSKAAYRGDKLTRGKWDELLASPMPYVAQRLAPPRTRPVERDGKRLDYKFDVRAVVYDGVIQMLAARLFHGQTTNFRAPGSGFAPVAVLKNIVATR